MSRGVNNVSSSGSIIRVGDSGSQIEVTLFDAFENRLTDVNALTYIRLSQENKGYIAVNNYTVNSGVVKFRMPTAPKGRYTLDIKDNTGRIFPADGQLYIDVVNSSEDGVTSTYVSYREEIDRTIADKMALLKGEAGAQGDSAYQVWLKSGNSGTVTDFFRSLKGDKGERGDGLKIDGVKTTVSELNSIPTTSEPLTYIVGTTLYFRSPNSSTWIKGADIKGVDGKAGSVVTITADGYWAIDGVKTSTLADANLRKIMIDSIEGLRTELDTLKNKFAEYATAGHNHDLTYRKLTDSYSKTETDNTFLKTTTASTTYATKGELTNYIKTADVGATFAVKGHTHEIGEVNGLATALAGKAPTIHSHTGDQVTLSDGTNVQQAINSLKATAGTGSGSVDLSAYSTTIENDKAYAAKTHYHSIADVTGLSDELSTKANENHTHTSADIIDFATEMAKKANVTHMHSMSQVTGLEAALSGKSNVSHTHSASEIKMSDGSTVEDKFKTVGTGSGTSVDPTTNELYINANIKFGLVGDGVTDNYNAFLKMADHINKYGGNIKAMPYYNDNGTIKRAEYRIGQYKTITDTDGTLATNSSKDIKFTGKGFTLDFCGAKVINMPMNGYTRSASFHNTDAQLWYSKEEPVMPFFFERAENFTLKNVEVDGENHKTKFQTGFTSKKFDNPRWTDGHGMETGRGHGIVLAGANNGLFENIISNRQQVDGVASSFYLDYNTMTAIKSTNCTFINLVTNGNGRLGMSGLGYSNNSFINYTTENNGMTLTNDGIWMNFNPAGGFDLEPHQSPISNENTTNTTWKTHLYNGNTTMENVICRNNSASGVSITSTMLTRNVYIKNLLVEVPKDHPGDYPMILMTAQNVMLEGVELRGKTEAGKLSRVVMYSVGGMVDNAGVIGGAAANVFSGIRGGQLEGIDFFMNDYGGDSAIINDIKSGEYGLHNGVLQDLVCTDCLFRLKHKRRFIMNNVVNMITANSPVNSFDVWGGVLNDVVLINNKSTAINIGFGSGDYHSEYERFRVKGLHTFKTGVKKYQVGDITSESMKQYSWTRTMDYLLANATGGGTTPTPADTTPPNAPTVNTVYTNSTTISGIAEMGSTVIATFNGGTIATATADNNNGSFSIVKPGIVSLVEGQTVSVVSKDSAGNTSTATVKTVSAAPTSSANLLGVMSNTASTVVNNEANKKVFNSRLSSNWNKMQTGITQSNWTVSTDKIEFVNTANEGVTGQSSSDRLIFFMFEGLKPNTTYTLSYVFSASNFVEGGYYLGGYANPTETPTSKALTFNTDSYGKFGYEFSGSKAFGNVVNPYDGGFIYKFGLPVGMKLTFDKMMLVEGAVAQPYVASV